jgi:plastocyanin
MRLALIALVLVSLVLVTGCSATPVSTPAPSGGSGPAPSAVAVSLQNTAFNPADIVVAVGGVVTFTNKDSVTHTVAGDGWTSGDVPAGSSFAHAFKTAGSFAIHCTIHPSMTANVTVR